MDFADFDDETLDEFVEEAMQAHHAPGIAVAVVHGEKTWAKGYGYTDLGKTHPITPHTLFFAGSTTKSFTAAMAAQLVESDNPIYKDDMDRQITWRTSLANLIRDDFVLKDEYATTHITLEDALSHRTGMSRHDMIWIAGEQSLRDQVRAMRRIPLTNELRTTWEYCNLMFTATAYAITEVVGGEANIASLAKQWIFDPLGMSETFYDVDDARTFADGREGRPHLALGSYWDDENEKQVEGAWEQTPPRSGAGGIISNVLDYTKWVRHLMSCPSTELDENTAVGQDAEADRENERQTGHEHGAKHAVHSALSRIAVEAMMTPRMLLSQPIFPCFTGPGSYGLGLFHHVYKGVSLWHHAGAIAGYMANMFMIPEKNWAVVTMQNAYSYAQDVVMWKLIDDFLSSEEGGWKQSGEEYKRWDMAGFASKRKEDAREKMKEENVMKRLFPDVTNLEGGEETFAPPSAPLTAFEGVYKHPAYHSWRVSGGDSGIESDDKAALDNRARDGETKESSVARLHLVPASPTYYLNVRLTLTHVSGDWWWAYEQMGPRQWVYDSAYKVKVEVDVNGKIIGLWRQTNALSEDLAWFEKIE